ncbi:hypothetical protein, partial [Mycobacterium avium]|uniref:hypothetical protein n=1 Tax=Mycobacterium avium TaxID=1764 RepID=UPI001F3A4412
PVDNCFPKNHAAQRYSAYGRTMCCYSAWRALLRRPLRYPPEPPSVGSNALKHYRIGLPTRQTMVRQLTKYA